MTNQINYTPANLGANPEPPGGAIIVKQNEFFGYMDSGNERSLYRKHLAKAFGNLHNSGLKSSPSLYNKNILGPFRTSYNAGDVITNTIVNTDIKYGREANQVGGNNLARVSGKPDGVSRNGSAMYSGNPKFVYDGSDYTRFKKLQAVNRTYNDSSFGLNAKDGSYVKGRLFRVR